MKILKWVSDLNAYPTCSHANGDRLLALIAIAKFIERSNSIYLFSFFFGVGEASVVVVESKVHSGFVVDSQ